MKYISKINLKNKIVLLRADLNSNVVNKKVILGERIKKTAETIKFLKKKKAKVVIIAHQGRPKKSDCTSLKVHAILLSRFTKVKFIPDLFGKKAEKAIKGLKSGGAILLENLRFYKEEFKSGKNRMVNALSKLCDIYINDTFSVCHRKHASMVSFPKYMKSYAGPLLEAELKALKKIKVKGALYILGGAKPEDNLKLLDKGEVLTCGLFGQMCLISWGWNLGAQNKYLKKTIKDYNKILRVLRKEQSSFFVPVDFGVKLKKGKRKNLSLSEFPSKYEIFDIGPKTLKNFIGHIKRAKSIYMKGPAGFCSDEKFCKGTKAILNAIAKNKGFSLIGGGHLSDAIKKTKINKNKFNHISLSGGALLRYIAGEKLPGLQALK